RRGRLWWCRTSWGKCSTTRQCSTPGRRARGAPRHARESPAPAEEVEIQAKRRVSHLEKRGTGDAVERSREHPEAALDRRDLRQLLVLGRVHRLAPFVAGLLAFHL